MARAAAVREIEALPEADRLEGFPHPRETLQLYGHDQAQLELVDTLQRGQVHHGWLLSGPPGIGKATLAYRFAKCLLASPEERDISTGRLEVPKTSVANRQVVSLSHPGLLVLRRPYDASGKRFMASIPVDEVRRLRSFLSHRAAQDSWRVVIVDSADDLNINAANALLKSLEEPPDRMVFLLVSSEPGRLLNTVRSRCRRLELGALDEAELKAATQQAFEASEADAPGEDMWNSLVPLARGSVRRLIGIHFAGGLELHQKIVEIFSKLPDVDWGRVHALADGLAPAAAAEKYSLYNELLFDTLAQVIKAGVGDDSGPSARAVAGKVVRRERLASWAALWETLVREEAETRALNLDRKAFIIGTIQRIEAVARQ
jgi:DNA polymerase III subunit delta'